MRVSIEAYETNVAVEGKVLAEVKRTAGIRLRQKFQPPNIFGSRALAS
jgi:hypothetical protein